MEKNTKKEDKVCAILYTISACLFLFTGISNIVAKGFDEWNGITNIALSVTFGSLAYMYFKKLRSAK